MADRTPSVKSRKNTSASPPNHTPKVRARKKATAKNVKPPSAPPNGETANGEQHRQPMGQLLSEFRSRKVSYLVDPFIVRGVLNLLVGESDVGKSALLAYAISKARFTILFPGFEEDPAGKLRDRLLHYGVDLSKVFVVQGPDWQLPTCKRRLLELAKDTKADLIAFDPIKSYIAQSTAENDAGVVRPALEAAAGIAVETGAPCLGVCHPGKAKDNVMRGSGEWRWVPRIIIRMTLDPGSDDKGTIQLYKNSERGGRPSWHYLLDKTAGRPAVFELGKPLSVEERRACKEDNDERTRVVKRRIAEELLRGKLAFEGQRADLILTEAERLGIAKTTVYDVAAELGIVMTQEGKGTDHRSFWSMP